MTAMATSKAPLLLVPCMLSLAFILPCLAIGIAPDSAYKPADCNGKSHRFGESKVRSSKDEGLSETQNDGGGYDGGCGGEGGGFGDYNDGGFSRCTFGCCFWRIPGICRRCCLSFESAVSFPQTTEPPRP